MARPLKNNADFYGHDSDMRKNIKVRAAKAKFGIYGGYVFPTLLEILTESDNLKIKINGNFGWDMLCSDFEIPGLELSQLKEILLFYAKTGSIVIADENGVIVDDLSQDKKYTIFSSNLFERMQALFDKRERQRRGGKKGKKTVNADGNRVIAGDNEVIADENRVIAEESKVKQSKAKANATFSTSSATANAVASNSEKGEIPPLRVGTSHSSTPPGGVSKTSTSLSEETEVEVYAGKESKGSSKDNRDPEIDQMLSDISSKTQGTQFLENTEWTRKTGKNLVALKHKLGTGQFWYRFDKIFAANDFNRSHFNKLEFIYDRIKAYAPSDPLEEICLRLIRIISGFCSDTPDDDLSKIISDNVGAARIKKHNLESVINCYRSASNGIEFEVEKLRTLATPEFIKKLDDILAEDGITIYNTDVAPLWRGCLIKKNT